MGREIFKFQLANFTRGEQRMKSKGAEEVERWAVGVVPEETQGTRKR